MTRRSGTTLIEVLVAIFVMAIGLLALLTLFPLGALRMAQAIHDARSAESGLNANSIAIMQDIRHDPLVITDGATPDFFVNSGVPGAFPADPYGESYAVFADPVGYYSVPAGVAQDWVGGQYVLRRRPVGFVSNASAFARNLNVLQAFTLWDDINFNNTTQPAAPQTVGPAIFRDSRFSWAYLLRRPLTSDRTVVEASVVVFDKRPLSLTGTLSLSETVYQSSASFDANRNLITVDYSSTGVAPPIRSGNWILDATIWNPSSATGSQHAYFYRVVAVNDLSATQVAFEVQGTIRGFSASMPQSAANVFTGTIIVLDGVAEVFEKGPGRTQ